jgi:photosystem II stability/assembly factor-like uncharacterized protein
MRRGIIIAVLSLTILNVNAQWNQLNGPYGGAVRNIFTKGNRMYAGTDGGGVFLSTDTGNSWSRLNGFPYSVNVTSISAFDTLLLATTNNKGLYLSSDSGTTWSQANNGFSSQYTNCTEAIGQYFL